MKNDCKIYKTLKNKIQTLGFGVKTEAFKRLFLPSWWESDMTENESFSLQLALDIAKKLHVSVQSLLNPVLNPVVEFANVAYKLPQNKAKEDVMFSTALLSSAADLVIPYFSQNFQSCPADSIRTAITGKNPCVNFYALLDYCWSLHIPVFHVSDFPHNGSNNGWLKPAAVTIRKKGGYVIFLCTKHHSQAEFLFELAHELGHIMLEHLTVNAIHCDVKSDFSEQNDAHESSANRFAETLIGSDSIKFPIGLSPDQLAILANREGASKQVDPGHLALHYGFMYKLYSVANAALSLIEQKKSRNPKFLESELVSMINQKAFAALDLEDMKPDDANFICGLTGILQEPVK